MKISIENFKIMNINFIPYVNQQFKKSVEFVHNINIRDYKIIAFNVGEIKFKFRLEILPDICEISFLSFCNIIYDKQDKIKILLEKKDKRFHDILYRNLTKASFIFAESYLKQQNINVNFPKIEDILKAIKRNY